MWIDWRTRDLSFYNHRKGKSFCCLFTSKQIRRTEAARNGNVTANYLKRTKRFQVLTSALGILLRRFETSYIDLTRVCFSIYWRAPYILKFTNNALSYWKYIGVVLIRTTWSLFFFPLWWKRKRRKLLLLWIVFRFSTFCKNEKQILSFKLNFY